MSLGAVVDAFISAIERQDVAAAAALLADDVLYDNVPMPNIIGRDAVAAAMAAFIGPATSVEWPVSRQVVMGNCVVNERVDKFHFTNGSIVMPVCGVWEVNDEGLITLWRDYFDLATFMTQRAVLSGA